MPNPGLTLASAGTATGLAEVARSGDGQADMPESVAVTGIEGYLRGDRYVMNIVGRAFRARANLN
ncbi:MAG: hypothetical protein AAFV33_29040 [Chloroflexota bacterium]